MVEYILMCEEHNRALINGFCVECGCMLDMQSTYLKPRYSQLYTPKNYRTPQLKETQGVHKKTK